MNKWTDAEKARLSFLVKMVISEQATYGKKYDLGDTIERWEYFLADEYSSQQVFEACNIYVKNNSDMPNVASIRDIIAPPEPEVSYEEYRRAQRAEPQGYGWGELAEEKKIVQRYHDQQNNGGREKIRNLAIENNSQVEIKSIKSGTGFKRLGVEIKKLGGGDDR